MIEVLLRKQKQFKKRLRDTWIFHVFGEKLFHSRLWVHDRRGVSGGLALGVFLSLTPTIPLQMIMAACGALYFRLNLPIALAACWISNPVTMAPIYLTSWKLGRFILEEVAVVEDSFDLFSQQTRIGTIIRHSAYLWTGSLILATAAAVAAWLLVVAIWGLLERLLHKNRAHVA